jgi:hypothetical protein
MGLIDEIDLHIAPILLGRGIRLYDNTQRPAGPAPTDRRRRSCLSCQALVPTHHNPLTGPLQVVVRQVHAAWAPKNRRGIGVARRLNRSLGPPAVSVCRRR